MLQYVCHLWLKWKKQNKCMSVKKSAISKSKIFFVFFEDFSGIFFVVAVKSFPVIFGTGLTK